MFVTTQKLYTFQQDYKIGKAVEWTSKVHEDLTATREEENTAPWGCLPITPLYPHESRPQVWKLIDR